MNRLKLDLKNKNPKEIVEICRKHKIAMNGNAHFPVTKAADSEFDATLEATKTALWDVSALKADLAKARTRLRQNVALLKRQLSKRAAMIESHAAGDVVKLASSGLSLRRDRQPVAEIDQPTQVTAKATEKEGCVRVDWTPVKHARVFAVEYSLADITPRHWSAAAPTTKSKILISDLKPGKRYAFRVRAHGTRDLSSPWTDEVVVMAV